MSDKWNNSLPTQSDLPSELNQLADRIRQAAERLFQPSAELQATNLPESGLLQLIETEFRQRIQFGENPTVEEYLQLYPELKEQLQARLANISFSGPALLDSQSVTNRVTISTAQSPPQLAGFEIIRELGRGGMGIVYLARQVALNRRVALKMILAGENANQQQRGRFLLEAEAVAALQHPNIVQLYEFGTLANDSPYFCLEFCDGGSLADYAILNEITPRRAAEIVEQIARGMYHAHERNILHRDLKPDNVLMTSEGQAKISDFGLARIGEGGLTRTNIVMGTPTYMAPEQAAGRTKHLGPWSDQWSIGVILYELLVSRVPFRGGTVAETLALVQYQDPVPPRQLEPSIPHDLETICLKCLRKEAINRYESCRELADDLRAFLDGRAISARPAGWIERAIRWCRRRPAWSAAIAASTVTAVIGVVGFIWEYREALQARNEAQTAAQLAQLAEGQARERGDELAQAQVLLQKQANELRIALADSQRRYALARFPMVEDALRRGAFVKAQQLLAEIPEMLRGWEWWFLSRQAAGAPARFPAFTAGPQFAHASAINSISVSPDGRWLATGSADSTIRLWNLLTPAEKPLRILLGHSQPIFCVRFSPDGKYLASAGADRVIQVWRVEGKLANLASPTRSLRGHDGPIVQLSWEPSGKKLVSVGGVPNAGEALVWDVQRGQIEKKLTGHSGVVSCVAHSPEGRTMWTGGQDQTIRVWDILGYREIAVWRGLPLPVTSLACAPDGYRLASLVSSQNHHAELRLHDPRTGRELFTPIRLDLGPTLGCAFSPDGTVLAAAGISRKIHRIDVRSGVSLMPVAMPYPIWSLAYSPDGRRLLVAGGDRGKPSYAFGLDARETVELGRSPQDTELLALRDDAIRLRIGSPIRTWVADARGTTFATWSNDYNLRLWRNGILSWMVKLDPREVGCLAIDPHGQYVVHGGATGKLNWREVRSGLVIHQKDIKATIHAIKFSPSGERLAVLSEDRKLRIGQLHQPWQSEFDHLPSTASVIAWHPDGFSLFVGSAEVGKAGDVRRLDLRDGTSLFFANQPKAVLALAVSPDGRTVVTGGADGTIRCFSTSGQLVHTGLSHGQEVTAVAISPDSQRIASVGREGTVRVWDIVTGTLLLTRTAETGVAYLGEGLVVAEKTALVWREGTISPISLPRWSTDDAEFHRGRAIVESKVRDHFAAAFHFEQAAMARPWEESLWLQAAEHWRVAGFRERAIRCWYRTLLP